MANKNVEFEIIEKKWILRRSNWEQFLDRDRSLLNKKLSNFCILFVCCNSYDATLKCLEYLKTETNQKFDIIIVDNSTKEEEYKLFYNLGVSNTKISIVKPIDNIWWSWWYSIWMEYVINAWYEYVAIFEDDIIPIEKDTISSTIEKCDEKVLVFNECKNLWNRFWYLHLACYPIDFIKKTWVVDPRFFLKSDDLERAERIQRVMDKEWYKKVSTWKQFYHPEMKKDWWKIWVTYLAIRNYLTNITKHFALNKLRYFITLFLYIWYWVSKVFFEWTFSLLTYILCAIKDYLFGNIWYKYNKKTLNKLFKAQLSKPRNCEDQWMDIKDISKISHSMFNLYWKMVWDYNSFSWFKYSKSIKDLKNWVIVNWIYSNIYPIFMNFNKILAVNEFDFLWDRVNVYVYDNPYKLKFLRSLLSFIISVILYIPILLLVLLKILLCSIFNCLIKFIGR